MPLDHRKGTICEKHTNQYQATNIYDIEQLFLATNIKAVGHHQSSTVKITNQYHRDNIRRRTLSYQPSPPQGRCRRRRRRRGSICGKHRRLWNNQFFQAVHNHWWTGSGAKLRRLGQSWKRGWSCIKWNNEEKERTFTGRPFSGDCCTWTVCFCQPLPTVYEGCAHIRTLLCWYKVDHDEDDFDDHENEDD